MSATKKDDKLRPVAIQAVEGETEAQSMARVMVEPNLRHSILTKAVSDKSVGKLPGDPQIAEFTHAMHAKASSPPTELLAAASQTLMAQAYSLDTLFTELARRATLNMGEYISASETYMRMALRAQAGSRATFEAVAKLHQPHEQTVKHVHVNEGGQAVVADHFHNNGGASENGKSSEQSHAAGTASQSAALPSPDPERDGVPIPGRSRKKTVQNARRDEPGCTKGEP